MFQLQVDWERWERVCDVRNNRTRTHKIAYQPSAPQLWETPSQQAKEHAPLLTLEHAVCPTLNDPSMHSDILQGLDLDAPAGLSFHQLPTINDTLPDHPTQFDKDWPQYLRPLPANIFPADYQYLKSKGALTIPGAPLRDALLHSFTFFVYPFLPAIDIGQVIARIQRNTGNRISLLLFQAIMHSAIPFVDTAILHNHGYKSKRQASQVFFRRVELLYKLDTETNPLALVQSLILMSLQCAGGHGLKDAWHYIGVAISLAQSIESDHRAVEIPPRLWKRVMWSCYMRDQITALTTQRPMRVSARDFRLPPLTADDFEPYPLLPFHRDTGARPNSPRQWDALIEMCLALTRCCLIIAYLLDRQYISSSCYGCSMDETTTRIVPRDLAPAAFNVKHCHTMLEEWHRSLRHDLKWHQQDAPLEMEPAWDTAIRIHRAVLQALYLVGKSALHSPQLTRLGCHPVLKGFSQTQVHEAATRILDIFSNLDSCGLVAFMPEVGAAVLQPAVIDCLYNLKSQDSAVRELAIANFQFCTRILRQMSGTYAATDRMLSLAGAGIQKLQAMAHNVDGARTDIPGPAINEDQNEGLSPYVLIHSENSLLRNVRTTSEERSFLGGLLAPSHGRNQDSSLNP